MLDHTMLDERFCAVLTGTTSFPRTVLVVSPS
jgi:hypothetical protein